MQRVLILDDHEVVRDGVKKPLDEPPRGATTLLPILGFRCLPSVRSRFIRTSTISR